MVKIWEEKRMETVRKWAKSSFFILLLISLLSLSYFAFFSSTYDDFDDWNCPSCPNFTAAKTLSPSPSPSPSPTSLSHIVFAIGASAATWHSRRSYSQLWWDPSSMRGHVWLDRYPDPNPVLPACATCPPLIVSPENTSRFGNRASASRIARIVADSYALGLPDVRWFVMGDDDTVFFPENLVSVLGKYDHNEMYYVGGAGSESVEQDEMHSYRMAFGGGGFAVSLPAARALAETMDGCLERYRGMWGSDQRVFACLSEIGVPLARHLGFHQVDLRGDIYGMLAAHPLAPLISLHHLDYVKPIFPLAPTQLDALQTLINASKFDPPRTLQQTFCYVVGQGFKWSISISWAYTVQIYPTILPSIDLETPLRTFQTWRTFHDGPFVFNTRPVRGSDRECEKPVLFYLNRIQRFTESTMSSTVTEYLRYEKGEKRRTCDGAGIVAASRVKLVRVISRQMDPNVWRKAPRRQCCETRRAKGGKVMEVKIRDCYPGEVTSPP